MSAGSTKRCTDLRIRTCGGAYPSIVESMPCGSIPACSEPMTTTRCSIRTRIKSQLRSTIMRKKFSAKTRKSKSACEGRGVANLYRYYVHAFMSQPQFSTTGKQLLEIARTYDSMFSKVFPPDTMFGRYFWRFFSRSRLDVLTYWLGRSGRAAYAHALNSAYRVYKRIRRIFIGS